MQYRVDGRVTQDSFTSVRAAREYAALIDRVGAAAAREVLLARDRVVAVTPTLADWTATYLDPSSGWLGGVTDGTRDGYRKVADRSFLPILGKVPLDRITKQDVARWVHWQEARPSSSRPGERVAAKTVRNYQALLSAVLAAAVEASHVPGNVARGVRLTAGVRGEMVIVTGSEAGPLGRRDAGALPAADAVPRQHRHAVG